MYNMDMITQVYTLNANRIFSTGNYNLYVHGSLHPDRTMDEHDFIYMLSGTWDVYQDDVRHSLSAGDVLLLHSGKHHYGLTPCAPGTRTMYIHFSPAEGDRVLEQDISAQSCSDHAVFLPTKINCGSNGKVKNLFEDIIYALTVKSYGYEIRLNSLCNLLLLELQSCLTISKFKQDEMVEKIIRLFQCNPEKHYTVNQLSALLYVSEKTLSRHFLKYRGKTVYAYQNDLKLEWVRQFLLENPTVTLHEAARNYGFCDEFHLSKAFKKKYGISPKEWRRN